MTASESIIPIKPLEGKPGIEPPGNLVKSKRVQSIDLLRGIVIIIMALDHVRAYFHYDAFFYSPTDLSQTNPALFFTRFITHYCAPVFIFLAGTAAYLSGTKKSKRELSLFLLTRGLWLVFVELFIISLFRTFNPAYSYMNLQVIWVIGISMMVLSIMIFLKRIYIVLIGVILVLGHNFLDKVHVNGDGADAVVWAILHEQKNFEFRNFSLSVNYPLIPWIGVMALGYCFGSLYSNNYNDTKRRKLLLSVGLGAVVLFIILRTNNIYGDLVSWSHQKNILFSFLSFINVTKYPPSLQYSLITLGPAFVFLSVSEKPLRSLGKKLTVFGRTPMFYYLLHILLIHIFASVAAMITGHPGMLVLYTNLFRTTALQGYGFSLTIVYITWMALVILMYYFCKWFDRFKRKYNNQHWWLSYL